MFFVPAPRRHFEDTLRSQAGNPNAVLEGLHLSNFAEEGSRQQREALASLLRERAEAVTARDTFRATQVTAALLVRIRFEMREAPSAWRGAGVTGKPQTRMSRPGVGRPWLSFRRVAHPTLKER